MLRHEISGFPLSAYQAYWSYPAYGLQHRKRCLEKLSAGGYITIMLNVSNNITNRLNEK